MRASCGTTGASLRRWAAFAMFCVSLGACSSSDQDKAPKDASSLSPQFSQSGPYQFDVFENEVVVGQVNATGGDGIHYRLVGDDASFFSVNDNGDIAFLQAPDYEAVSASRATLFQFQIEASNRANKSSSIPVQVSLQNRADQLNQQLGNQAGYLSLTALTGLDNVLVFDSARDAGGNLFIALQYQSINATSEIAIAKLDSEFRLATDFAVQGVLRLNRNSASSANLKIDSQQRIIVALHLADGFSLQAFDSFGKPVPNFVFDGNWSGGALRNAEIVSVSVVAGGIDILLDAQIGLGNEWGSLLCRFDGTAQLDKSFNANGENNIIAGCARLDISALSNDLSSKFHPYSVVTTMENAAWVVGEVQTHSSDSSNNIVFKTDVAVWKLDANGHLDNAFAGQGFYRWQQAGMQQNVYQAVITSNGGLTLVGGSHDRTRGETKNHLTLWQMAGDGSGPVIYHFRRQRQENGYWLQWQADSQTYLVVSAFADHNSSNRASTPFGFSVMQLSDDGELDSNGFNRDGVGGDPGYIDSAAAANVNIFWGGGVRHLSDGTVAIVGGRQDSGATDYQATLWQIY